MLWTTCLCVLAVSVRDEGAAVRVLEDGVSDGQEGPELDEAERDSIVHSVSGYADAVPQLGLLQVLGDDSKMEWTYDTSQCAAHNLWTVTQSMTTSAKHFKKENDKVFHTCVLGLVAGISTMSLFFGAKLGKVCLPIGAFVVSYYLGVCLAFMSRSWVNLDICVVPLIFGIVLGGIAALACIYVLYEKSKIGAVGVTVIGVVLGLVLALLARGWILELMSEMSWTKAHARKVADWYWLIATSCALLGGALFSLYADKSDKLLTVATALAGAWGLSFSLLRLIAIWAEDPPQWAFLLSFCITLTAGILTQRKTSS